MGAIFLLIAWLAAVGLTLTPAVGQYYRAPRILGLVRPLGWVLVASVSLSFFALIWAFVDNNFHYVYVAHHSSEQLPFMYRLTAAWGGHEGSLLLWVFLMNIWTVVFLKRYTLTPLPVFHNTLAVLGLVNLCLLTLLLFASTPFAYSATVLKGLDLNPLLQDPGMVSHPPMLYMGYVGYACVYAHAMAGLVTGQLDESWLRMCRKLSQIAWAFLTIGISLGSWWAYRELGWGGYWFWDPVENAALMPWLCGTALMHTLLLVKKTQRYYSLSFILIIMGFSLSLLGTFLVRSGVSMSVHAFASDPMRGSLILTMFTVLTLGSFTLLWWRQKQDAPFIRLGFLSKPQLLLMCCMLMCVLLGCVMLGTLYPIFLSAFAGQDISVGPPYYEAIFMPIGWIILCMMGFVYWPQAVWWQRLMQIVCCVLAVLGIIWVYHQQNNFLSALQHFWQASIGLLFSFWMLSQTVVYAISQYRRKGWRHGHYGVIVGHLGFCIFSVGLTLSSAFSVEEQLIMRTGESTTLQHTEWTLQDTYGVVGPNYRGVGAEIRVQEQGKERLQLYPEKRIYTVSQYIMTDAAIDPGLFRDLFVSLGEPQDNEVWSLRISIKPFIGWMWMGAFVIALGGFLAALKRKKPHEH